MATNIYRFFLAKYIKGTGMKKGTIKTAVVLTVFIANCQAADWPRYLGPEGNSTSREAGILRSWPEAGPEVLWTVPVGIGFGGPAIKDGKVYLLDRDDEVGDNLRCLDLTKGRELWNFAYEAPGKVMFPGSRSIPTVDGDYVYSVGPYGDLYCIDIKTHKPVWHKNIWTDFGGGKIPIWAITQSPLVYGDLLIVASQAPDAGIVAYEKLSGKYKWQTKSLGLTGYVSPSLVKVKGQDHVVMITASGRRGSEMGKIVGINPSDGRILWEYANWNCHIPVASAFDVGDGKVLAVGGYELGATMIQVEKKTNGRFEVKELFTTEEFGDQTKPPLLHEGYFYAQYGTNRRRDGLVCMNMDGEVMWKTKRDPDFNKGSMILADGLILATDGGKGLYLIEPDPTGFKPLAKAEPLAIEDSDSEDDSIAARVGGKKQNWAPLALSNGMLLIRDQKRMMCLRVAR